ncbi:MAG TPA: hypothetical protein VF828_00425 [Patescibacteria group bacterium]
MKNKILIGLFLVTLAMPGIGMLTKLGNNISLEENRDLAVKPTILTKEYPKLFTNYFNDHFGFRNQMIVADRRMRYSLFNVSPNKKIIIGKGNWLFYAPDSNYIDSVNGQPFSKTDLEQIKNNLADIQKNFENMGVKFYFLAAPNKQSIYPEFLPDSMKKVRPDSRLDQISNYLKDNQEINFINPKEDLIEAKKNNQVYLKYDTHWNQMGALTAYQKLFLRLKKDFKTLEPKAIDDFTINLETAPNNDLALQMGVAGNFVESEKVLKNKDQKAKIVFENCPKQYTGCPVTVREVQNPKLPKLVMFRDSFGAGLIPFVAEHFQRSYFFWGTMPYSTDIIKKEKPDIVIMELTERELWRLNEKVFEF